MENNFDKNINLIKDSFESKKSKAPEFIWDNLDKQLYIDRVWMKLKIKLDYIQILKIRIRFIVYSAVVILLLLFVGIYFSINEQQKIHKFTSENSTLKSVMPNNNNIKNITTSKVIISKKYLTKNDVKVSNSEINFENSDVSAKQKTLNNKKTNNALISNLQINNSNKFYHEMSVVSKQILSDLLISIEPKEIKKIDYDNDITNQIHFPEYIIDTSKQFDKHYFVKNEVGLIYSINNTILINNDFIESNREGSMVSITPSFASGYGLVYNYKFSKSNAVSLELYFLSNQNQNVYLYSNGKYYKKTIKLGYSKSTVTYQKNISFKNMNPNNWYFIKVGGYFSVLTKNEIYYVRDNEKTNMPTSTFSNNDYGLKLGIGRERETKYFIIGGGLQSEYGLKNIFKGDKIIPSDFNRTNNFSYGLFVTLKLKY